MSTIYTHNKLHTKAIPLWQCTVLGIKSGSKLETRLSGCCDFYIFAFHCPVNRSAIPTSFALVKKDESHSYFMKYTILTITSGCSTWPSTTSLAGTHVAPIQCVARVASVGDSCTHECLVLSLWVVAQHSICDVWKTPTVHNCKQENK